MRLNSASCLCVPSIVYFGSILQDFGGLCVSLIELPELRQVGGQENVTLPHIREPQRKFVERRQRHRIFVQRIVGEAQLAQCPR